MTLGDLPALPTLRARTTTERHLEPVSVGVPFARGLCADPAALGLRAGTGHWIPAQWEVLSRWPDGSVRWALLDFQATVPARGEVRLRIEPRTAGAGDGETLAVQESGHGLEVDNGALAFLVSALDGSVLARSHGVADAPSVAIESCLTTLGDKVLRPRLQELAVEARGPVRTTLRAIGEYRWGLARKRLRYEARISVYAGSGRLRMEVALHNPAAARHRGGVWDLGDPGSVRFRDFSLHARLRAALGSHVGWTAEPGDAWYRATAAPVEIYQESSGGENWRSRNHVNREGRVPLRFRGYRLRHPDGECSGQRANPVVSIGGAAFRLAGAVEQLWQNFPKAIEATHDSLSLRLFPRQFEDGFELLGGEQKTHRVWFDLVAGAAAVLDDRGLDWVHQPLVFSVEPAWHASAGTLCASTGATGKAADTTRELVESALEGPSCFFQKREVVDEYGWRHFGEVYADHENAYFQGERPVVSHYNNQYDLVGGFLTQYLLSGDARWYELGRDLAHHVLDIDLYRTAADKAAYSGGLFWHTDHYQDAHRAGHRTYSADSPRAREGRSYGGGPSNEHNYTSGLLLFHHLTGSRPARDAVVSLARWVLAMDDGRQTLLGAVDARPTGHASATSSVEYHGPGRGAGNSINALLDAFTATGERAFMDKAEELVRRCIHPRDDVAGRGLGDIEARWSYLVFLQALGKYLEVKAEMAGFDSSFFYARESLLAYARWMRENEVPFRCVLDRVEYPTETWPAHDLRKGVVFGFGARYAEAEERAAFLECAARFHREALAGLMGFESRTCTRPLAIVLQNEPLRAWLMRAEPAEVPPPPALDFGSPVAFQPQKARVLGKLRSPRGFLALSLRLARPDRMLALLRLAAAEASRRWL